MDWMRYRIVYLLISGIILAVGIYSLVAWRLNLSIDFTGGSVIEYQVERAVSVEEFKNMLQSRAVDFPVVDVVPITQNAFIVRTSPINQQQAATAAAKFQQSVGRVSIVRFESVGPTLSSEILRKTIIGLVIAAVGILLWVAWQFKSVQFGISAILAMLHDSLVLVGTFSLFGHFYRAPIDTLFVTALLTTLAFSVHDTIVVFDRIREMKKKLGGSLYDLANLAVSQTMVRSLNNSLTIIFVLVALVLLGGQTLFWFAVALLVGTITGTYSSPFVAVPLLVTWEQLRTRR